MTSPLLTPTCPLPNPSPLDPKLLLPLYLEKPAHSTAGLTLAQAPRPALALLQSPLVGAGVGSGVWYGISIQLSSSRSKTWTAAFTPWPEQHQQGRRVSSGKRGREGGAGKKPMRWESDLPRASQSVGGRSSFTDPG